MKHLRGKRSYAKILKVTTKLFVRKGYHGTSMSDISKATKLTKGAIYCHFESKEALLKKIFEEYERIYLDKMIEEVESVKGKAIDKMKHMLRFSTNFAAQNIDLCLCLATLSAELYSSSKKYERYIKRVYMKHHKFLSNLLEKGVKDGSFRKDINSNFLSLNLIGANEGNLLQWNLNRPEYNGRVFSRSYIKFFLSGICRPR